MSILRESLYDARYSSRLNYEHARNRFIDALTYKQYQVYMHKGSVPQYKGHQDRFTKMLECERQYEIACYRVNMYLDNVG